MISSKEIQQKYLFEYYLTEGNLSWIHETFSHHSDSTNFSCCTFSFFEQSLSVWSKMILGPTSDKTPLCILSYRHLDRKTNLQILNFTMLTNILEMWFWNFCKERRVYPDKWGEMILFFRDEPKHDNPLARPRDYYDDLQCWCICISRG